MLLVGLLKGQLVEPADTHRGTTMCSPALLSSRSVPLARPPLSVVRLALLLKASPGGGQVLLTLSEDKEPSSRTLPPSELPSAQQARLPGLWGLPPCLLPGIQSPLLGPEAVVSPQGLWLLLEGRSPRAEGWRPATSLEEAAGANGWASRGEPGVMRCSPLLGEAGPPHVRLHPEAPLRPQSTARAGSLAFQGECEAQWAEPRESKVVAW